MKKHKIGSNQNKRKLFDNNHQLDRYNLGYLYKTLITLKTRYLQIIHKNYLYNESSTN